MSSCPLQACDGGDDTAAAFAALCEPQHLRGQLALARRPASAEATAARQSVSLQAAQQTFTAGLQAAAAFMAQAVQPATAAARERHAAELQRWLAARHCSLTTCSPEALLAYVTMHWLPKHTGSELSTGERVAAPSSLANMLSHLSSHFEHIEGRNGAHQLLNGVQHGNPVRSSCIAELRQGYCNAMRNKGVCQGAAVPVSFEQASQLRRRRGGVGRAPAQQRSEVQRRGQRAGELQTSRIANCVVEKPFQRGGWVGKAVKASPLPNSSDGCQQRVRRCSHSCAALALTFRARC